MPADLDLPMTGITVKPLTDEEYYEKWVKLLSLSYPDSSTVALKVLYYDELDYANQVEDLSPIAETIFTL